MYLEPYMRQAIGEAERSLRDGNKGFGAVVVKDGEVVAVAHDREVTDGDPTSHAETNAVRAASRKLGKSLAGCALISTHEPCPMCAFAIAWSGITEVAYGYGIQDAIAQGRRRIDFPCTEAFSRAGAPARVYKGILHRECSILYRADVRKEIEALRNCGDEELQARDIDATARRTAWFQEKRSSLVIDPGDPLDSAYRVLLTRFGASPEQMPVIEKTTTRMTFHSMNFCPTLEACRILQLDTRHVCRRINESATDALVKLVDPRLRFSRNYDTLRPHTEYCEESITMIMK